MLRLVELAESRRDTNFHTLHLAVSVNAPNDRIRSRIMPVNRLWPMAELHDAMVRFEAAAVEQALSVEYVLLGGVNDAPAHARELISFLDGLDAPIYLIPHNPGPYSELRAPTQEAVSVFFDEIRAARRKVRLRATRGDQILAGCGQLATRSVCAADGAAAPP